VILSVPCLQTDSAACETLFRVAVRAWFRDCALLLKGGAFLGITSNGRATGPCTPDE
jgi:hypothetical protein